MLPSIVPYATLHPQRAHVLRELAVALDDPKRVVRKEAVLARCVILLPCQSAIDSDVFDRTNW